MKQDKISLLNETMLELRNIGFALQGWNNFCIVYFVRIDTKEIKDQCLKLRASSSFAKQLNSELYKESAAFITILFRFAIKICFFAKRSSKFKAPMKQHKILFMHKTLLGSKIKILVLQRNDCIR